MNPSPSFLIFPSLAWSLTFSSGFTSGSDYLYYWASSRSLGSVILPGNFYSKSPLTTLVNFSKLIHRFEKCERWRMGERQLRPYRVWLNPNNAQNQRIHTMDKLILSSVRLVVRSLERPGWISPIYLKFSSCFFYVGIHHSLWFIEVKWPIWESFYILSDSHSKD